MWSTVLYVNSSSSTLYCNPENKITNFRRYLSLYIFQKKIFLRPPAWDLFSSPGAPETKLYFLLALFWQKWQLFRSKNKYTGGSKSKLCWVKNFPKILKTPPCFWTHIFLHKYCAPLIIITMTLLKVHFYNQIWNIFRPLKTVLDIFPTRPETVIKHFKP